jgi:hypothetical protein
LNRKVTLGVRELPRLLFFSGVLVDACPLGSNSLAGGQGLLQWHVDDRDGDQQQDAVVHFLDKSGIPDSVN